MFSIRLSLLALELPNSLLFPSTSLAILLKLTSNSFNLFVNSFFFSFSSLESNFNPNVFSIFIISPSRIDFLSLKLVIFSSLLIFFCSKSSTIFFNLLTSSSTSFTVSSFSLKLIPKFLLLYPPIIAPLGSIKSPSKVTIRALPTPNFLPCSKASITIVLPKT